MRSAVLLALGVWAADLATKHVAPTLLTTDRLPVSVMMAALILVVLVPGRSGRASILARAAIIGGGLGNLTDMLVLGQIRDIVALGPLAFNLADGAILAGLLIWLVLQLRVV